MGWSQDEIAKVKDYLAEGLSAAQIGRALGKSRNGVLGLISRKGLRNGRSAIPTPRRVPSPPRRAPGAPRSTKAKPPSLPAPPADMEPIGPIGTSAGRNCCQYPYGDVATPDLAHVRPSRFPVVRLSPVPCLPETAGRRMSPLALIAAGFALGLVCLAAYFSREER